ncbi:hypothetical protein ACFV27_40390 [Streptomyces antimycoticus]|uniref:hypothetical protein n=1 Tax=Streptomyces antimycoticus TaxID=68175 RepID=UPI00368B0070
MTDSPFPADQRIVLIGDPRVRAVPVRDCGEPLVDCRGRLRVDPRRADPAPAAVYGPAPEPHTDPHACSPEEGEQ